MTLDALRILPTSNASATLSGSWKRVRYWDWSGTLRATEPIVAVTMMQVGERLEWARSEKGPTVELEVRLLLGFDEPSRKTDVYVSFSLGQNITMETLPPISTPVRPKRRGIVAGWICFVLGLLTFWLFGLGFLFLLIALALGVMLLLSNRVVPGVLLTVCSAGSIAVCGLLFIALIPVLAVPLIKKRQQEQIAHFIHPSPTPDSGP